MTTTTTPKTQTKTSSPKILWLTGEQVLGIAFLVSVLFVMSGAGVFVYQCFKWLKTGHWEHMSFVDGWAILFHKAAPPFADWAVILTVESHIPMSVFLIGAGMAILFLTIYLLELGESK